MWLAYAASITITTLLPDIAEWFFLYLKRKTKVSKARTNNPNFYSEMANTFLYPIELNVMNTPNDKVPLDNYENDIQLQLVNQNL